MGKVLRCIILTDRLGDIIAAEPVARHLRTSSEYLVWLVQPRYQDLLRYNPHLDAVQTVSCYTETVFLRKILKNIRWSNLHFDGYFCDRFVRRAHNKIDHGLDETNYFKYGALTDVFSLTGTGMILGDKPRIYPNPAFNVGEFLGRFFASGQNPLLIFHSISDDPIKNWNREASQLAIDNLLKTTNINILEVGLRPVLRETPRCKSLGTLLPLADQLAIFCCANVFVGVDSGFSHVANAVGVPSVLLLGPYKGFDIYLPWKTNEGDVVLHDEHAVTNISSIDVEAAVRKQLGKE